MKEPEKQTDVGNEPISTQPTEPGTTQAGDAGLSPVNSYAEIEEYFSSLKKDYEESVNDDAHGGIWESFREFVGGGLKSDSAMTNESVASENSISDDSLGNSAEYGTTNVQVDGVDEADIIKNDGKYIYYITDSTVKIISALPADKMTVLSTIKLGKDDSLYVNDIYVLGDRLVANCSDYDSNQDKSVTMISVYDITDRTAPKVVKTFSQDGNLLTSRLIGSELYIVSTYGINIWDLNVREDEKFDENEILPEIENDGTTSNLPCDCVSILPDSDEPSYLVISGINLDDLTAKVDTSAVLGGGSNAYCTTDALYVACEQYENHNYGDFMWRFSYSTVTNIYRFKLDGGSAVFDCKGVVDGGLLNQFSMDEYNGFFRIATTSTEDGDEINILSVLNSKLETVGSINDIAKGETIRSARFIGERGYLVTFEQTDPLFVIDLSVPTAPKILGELKIPGFSSYLHPYGDKYLIGVGTDGTESGATDDVKISLFDISDPSNPVEIDKQVIDNAYTDIQYNHKIMMFCDSQGLFGLPVETQMGNSAYYVSIRRFYTFKVEDGKLINQFVFNNASTEELSEYYYAQINGDLSDTDYSIDRGTYIGTTLYTLSPDSIAAHSLTTGEKISTLLF